MNLDRGALTEDELDAFCNVSAVVLIGLQEARKDKDCDDAEVTSQARDLVSSYLEARMGFDRETSDALATSLFADAFSEGKM